MTSPLVSLNQPDTKSKGGWRGATPQHGSPHVASTLLSFVYAGRGLLELVRTQRNARIHLGMAVLVVLLGLWLGISTGELSILCGTITLVIAAEAINTAIEAVVDLASPEYHPLARRAKDVAAGAVLWCALGAVVTGSFVLGPPLIARIGW